MGKDCSVLVRPVVEPGHGGNLGLVQFVVSQGNHIQVDCLIEDRLRDLLDQVVLQIQLLKEKKRRLMFFRQRVVELQR